MRARRTTEPSREKADFCGATHVGRKRSTNQDSWAAQALEGEGRFLLAVADGMGGHAEGELASSVAIAEVSQVVRTGHHQLLDSDPPVELIRYAVQRANQAVYREAQSRGVVANMGATLTAVLVIGDKAYIGHVGDSRVYLVRNGQATQITKDHSWVQELVDSKEVSVDQAERHPRRNELTRAIGISPQVEVDCHEALLLTGDWLLLCTDGAWQYLPAPQFGRIAGRWPNPQDATKVMIRMANARGGRDNITVVAARFGPAPRPKRTDAVAVILGAMIAVAFTISAILYLTQVHRQKSGTPPDGTAKQPHGISIPVTEVLPFVQLRVRSLGENRVELSGTAGCRWQVWQGRNGSRGRCDAGTFGSGASRVKLPTSVQTVPQLSFRIERTGSEYRYAITPPRDIYHNGRQFCRSGAVRGLPRGNGWFSFYLIGDGNTDDTVVVRLGVPATLAVEGVSTSETRSHPHIEGRMLRDGQALETRGRPVTPAGKRPARPPANPEVPRAKKHGQQGDPSGTPRVSPDGTAGEQPPLPADMPAQHPPHSHTGTNPT